MQQQPNQPQTPPPAGAADVATNQPNNTIAEPGGPAMPEQDTNQFPATNAARANNFAGTNTMDPGTAAAFGLTNRLATMAPAQAQTVVQVQVGLTSLQEISVNIGPVGNVREVLMQNPGTQQRFHQVCGKIIGLARGWTKPSFDSVDRLAVDLLRACSRARWEREHQLVLAIIINDACNCENLTAAQVDESVNNGLMVLRAAGVSPAYCNSIGCDLHSIAFEVQPNLAL
ncbi:MAG TPA: hypothetical protein VGI88_09495 [Verrucomicrobiae bacterium]|jgi:hypothetical protein